MIGNVSNMKERGCVVDGLTLVIFLCWAVAGVCGFAALICVYLKKPLRPVLVAFSISVLISFVAMLFLPRL